MSKVPYAWDDPTAERRRLVVRVVRDNTEQARAARCVCAAPVVGAVCLRGMDAGISCHVLRG